MRTNTIPPYCYTMLYYTVLYYIAPYELCCAALFHTRLYYAVVKNYSIYTIFYRTTLRLARIPQHSMPTNSCLYFSAAAQRSWVVPVEQPVESGGSCQLDIPNPPSRDLCISAWMTTALVASRSEMLKQHLRLPDMARVARLMLGTFQE